MRLSVSMDVYRRKRGREKHTRTYAAIGFVVGVLFGFDLGSTLVCPCHIIGCTVKDLLCIVIVVIVVTVVTIGLLSRKCGFFGSLFGGTFFLCLLFSFLLFRHLVFWFFSVERVYVCEIERERE